MREQWDSPSPKKKPPSDAAKYQPGTPPSASPPEPDLPTWTFRDTVVGTLLTLVPLLALTAPLFFQSSTQPTISRPLSPTEDIENAALTLVVSALLEAVFLIAPLWFAVFAPRRRARQRGLPEPAWREGLRSLGLRACPLWQGLSAFALGVLAIFAATLLYSAIAQALNISVQTNVDQLLAGANNAPWTTLATLLVAVIVAPFCEEIFFRGYFFQGLRLRISLWLAVVLSAVIFGLSHGSLGSLALLIVIGLALAIIRWRTRSLWPGMALHMLNNFVGAWVIFQALHL